ncbi:hypothetical protein PROFUN_00360 [Planoprotostelium fungivorum]|uniref:Uncharacterized protein n=1 Tax=Planoprotostelium fungivorum TaxID=1890364 RepID=A0A2P6NY86_9EUKA|nr:hypothetical protein PROFUN_00360 [Planoprotostelium fungivorum]
MGTCQSFFVNQSETRVLVHVTYSGGGNSCFDRRIIVPGGFDCDEYLLAAWMLNVTIWAIGTDSVKSYPHKPRIDFQLAPKWSCIIREGIAGKLEIWKVPSPKEYMSNCKGVRWAEGVKIGEV